MDLLGAYDSDSASESEEMAVKPTEAATTEPAAAAESAAAEPQRKAAPAPPPRTALPSAADLLASASVPEFIAASRSTTAEPAAPAGPAAGTGSATQDAGRKRKAPPGPSPMLPPQIRRPNVVTEDADAWSSADSIKQRHRAASERAKGADKKESFNQKEKRKRDLGQASRGKNYVEEEKRILRQLGM